MGVIATDEWLEKEKDQPVELCKRANPEIENPHHFYLYLCKFGMYEVNRYVDDSIQMLKNKHMWKKLETIYQKYKKRWNGHELDIYLFPINRSYRTIQRNGLAFKDKIFLFLGDVSDKEMEAQFIHEYHHSVRMNQLAKNEKEYTLLDSLVFEGLADHAVLLYCGKDYTITFTRAYDEAYLDQCWETQYEKHLHKTRDDPIHDYLLFGPKRNPMLGYAIGNRLIEQHINKKKISIHDTFTMESEQFLPK